jgi:CDP-glucose 4,6-dehydratase
MLSLLGQMVALGERLRGYLLLAEALAKGEQAPQAVNLGPAEAELSVRQLLDLWQVATGRAVDWRLHDGPVMAEKPRLALDSALARQVLGWRPAFDAPGAVAETARWYGAWAQGADLAGISEGAIRASLEG